MSSIRVSLQLPNNEPTLATGHKAAGFVREPDLVVFPRIQASLIQSAGPYVAYVVHFDEDEPTDEVSGIERISCKCEEVVLAGTVGYASFRLAYPIIQPGTLPVGEDLIPLLTSTQNELWPDPAEALDIPSPPRFDHDARVVFALGEEGEDGFSLCRWFRC